MKKIRIDLRDDPEIPLGREIVENLVGAHLAARDEEELATLVCHSLDELLRSSPERSIRLLTHAAYRGQDLLVRLLNLIAAQQIAMEEAGVFSDPGIAAREPNTFAATRLAIWHELVGKTIASQLDWD